MTSAAPSGVVTFLFTDVEGSTSRWVGIATDEAELRGTDYFGAVLNCAARVAAGHGGQILLAESTAVLLSGFDLVDLGPRRT